MVCEKIETAVKSDALDKRLGILKVCDQGSGALKLLIIRLTAHCNALKRDNYMISHGFFGAARELLKECYNCPVMVVQGAAGNIAPKYFNSKETPIDASGEHILDQKLR